MRKKQKAAKAGLLVTSCIGMILSGCGADAGTSEDAQVPEPIVYEVGTDAEVKGTSEESEPDKAVTNETEEESPAQADATGLYEQFLSNSASVTISSDCPLEDYMTPIFEAGDSFTLTELGDCVSGYYLNPEYTDKKSYDEVQYAYVPCPDSADEQNLLVKFVGLNIYSPDDESYAVFVITQDNGQLYISYLYECWARSATMAHANGLLSEYGSHGAGAHSVGLSAMLANGKNTRIYGAEVLMGTWTSSVNETIYHEVFDENTITNLTVSIYHIGDNEYYWYDMSDCDEDDKERCETYISRCREEAGISFVTQEEIQALIKARCQEIGVDYSLTEQEQEAVWQKL